MPSIRLLVTTNPVALSPSAEYFNSLLNAEINYGIPDRAMASRMLYLLGAVGALMLGLGFERPEVLREVLDAASFTDVVSRDRPNRAWSIASWGDADGSNVPLSLTDAARERLRAAHDPRLRVSWPMIIEWRGRVVSATFVSQGFEFHSRGKVPMSMTEGDDPSVILAERRAALDHAARQ